MKYRFFLYFLLSSVCAFADFALGKQNFHALRTARHDNYELSFRTTEKEQFAIIFGRRDETPAGLLQYAEGKLSLQKLGQASKLLGEASLELPPSELIIRHHNGLLEVVADRKILFRTMTDGLGRGEIAVAGQVECTGYQRLEAFQFGDDFMRTEEEAKEWGLWEPLSGHWVIHSVMERIQANPDARIREGRIPVPDRSPNPFCLAGSAQEGEALIRTGQEFWCDYEAGVSIRPAPGATFGIAVSVHDASNLFLLRWSLPSLGMKPAEMSIIQRKAGKDTVLASAILEGRADNWQRLALRTRGGRLQAFLDKVPVLSADAPESTGGKIALYATGNQETRFDDVTVHSLPDLEYSDLPQVSSKLFHTFGLTSWKDASISATVSGKGELALIFGYRDAKNYWKASWRESWGGGKAILSRTVNGKEKKLASLECPAPSKVAVYPSAEEGVRFFLDEELVLRVPPQKDFDFTGCCGTFGATGRSFSGIRCFCQPERDWERPVDVEKFANDPFMQGWASTRYSWIRQGEINQFPQTNLFTGDLYGAFRLELPLLSGIQFHFGLDTLSPKDGYTLACKLDEKSGKGSLTLTRNGKKLSSASFSGKQKTILPGSQIIDEKIGARPRTPDTPSWGRITLQRDGHAIWVSVDGMELFSVLEDKPLTGRAAGLTLPCAIDFIHVSLLREKLLDYLFEQAETDWGGIGRWEVTNRFACDPRWSHENGESKGVASLWSKFDLEGDFTIECFAGMRMRQGELLEGAKMSYPRVGDINFALNGDGRELFSGYNFLIAAWDKDWSEQWSRFLRKGETVAKSDTELIPRGRHYAPKSRAVEVVWDPGGRPVHGAWYAVKIRRTGDSYSVWFDNLPVLQFEDKSPLSAGGRIALWTQHNSIVIARMKVGYRHLSRKAPALQATAALAPAPIQEATPSNSFQASFMDGTNGVKPWNGDQSAEVSLGKDKDLPFLRAENVNSGGDFGLQLPFQGVDLLGIQELSFRLRLSPNAKINLYFTVEDEAYHTYFVTLSGPGEAQPNRTPVGSAAVKPNEWCEIRLPLAKLLEEAAPWRSSWKCSSMMLGMLHEGYLNAGLNGNYEGTTYDLADLKAIPVPASSKALPVPSPADGAEWALGPIAFQFPADSFPDVASCKLTIGNMPFLADAINVTIDQPHHILTFHPTLPALTQEQLKAPVSCQLNWKWRDGTEASLSWNLVPKPSLDRTAPGLPLIVTPAPSPKSAPFQQLKDGSYSVTSALEGDGRQVTTVTSQAAGASMALDLAFPNFNAIYTPYLLFDYAIEPNTYVDLNVHLQGGRAYQLGLTDCDQKPAYSLDNLEGVQADGKWHTAIVPIRERLFTYPQSWNTRAYPVHRLAIGNFGYSGVAPGRTYRISNPQLVSMLPQGELSFEWAAADPSGIRGYAVLLDDQPSSIPQPQITHQGTKGAFPVQTPGLHFLHVRACDNNGNWGQAAHAAFCVIGDNPTIAALTPTLNEQAAPSEIKVQFSGKEVPDFTNARFEINQVANNSLVNTAHWDSDTHSLSLNLLNTQIGTASHKDGENFQVALKGLQNSAGQELPDVQWSWNLDYTKDTTIPAPPRFYAYRYSMTIYDCFSETTMLNWNSFGVTLNRPPKQDGGSAMQIISDGSASRALLHCWNGRQHPDNYPRIRFHYCLQPGSTLKLLFYANRRWQPIHLAGTKDTNDISEAPALVADGAWHWYETDIAPLLQPLAENGEFPIFQGVGFGTCYAAGKYDFQLDDFALIAKVPLLPIVSPSARDESGIKRVAYCYSREEDTVPEFDPRQPDENKVARPVFVFDQPGRWYLHAFCEDSAGHCSRTIHIPVIATNGLPAGSEDGLESLPISPRVVLGNNNWILRTLNGTQSRCVCQRAKGPDGNQLLLLTPNNAKEYTVLLCPNDGKAAKSLKCQATLLGNDVEIQSIAFQNGKNLKQIFDKKNIQYTSPVTKLTSSKGQPVELDLAFSVPPETPPAWIGFIIHAVNNSRPSLLLDQIRN